MKSNLNSQDYKVLIALCITIVGSMSINDMLLPSLPAITRALHTETSVVQQSLALFFIAQAASTFICGPCSDIWGRKRTMLTALCFTLVVSICLIFVSSIDAYLYLKFFQGLGSGAGMSLTRVIMVDYFKNKSLVKFLSIFSMSAIASPLVMPSIGGYIQEVYGWQANFIASCAVIIITILSFHFMSVETRIHKVTLNIKNLAINYKTIISDKSFLLWTLLNSACVASYYSYTTVSPFLFQNYYKFSPLEFGYICAFITSANIISKSILVLISHKCNKHITNHFSAITIAMIGGYFYNVKAGPYEAMLLLFTFMLVIGFATPIISARALFKFDKIRGTAGALYSTITLIITSIICNIIGILPDLGLHLLGATFSILGVCMLFGAIAIKELEK